MPWPPHRTLYELGRGGMGVVELAEVGSGLVAVKRILPYRAGDAKTRSSFLREARLLARIDHPNVVRALGVDEGRGDEPPALMMQYVAGVPLKELIEASPAGLPVPVAARLGLEVARGLHAAHELCDEQGRRLGVVHRDVSPHNVLVTFDGRAVLLDFGVAKVNDATRTLTGEVKGKLAYMAPEQAMADPVDRRSDLYALGALLYEMLCGRRMHGEGTDLEILKRMVSERPAPLRARRPELPEGLERLVARMTDESPDRRPSTGDEVAAALEPFAAGAGPAEVSAQLERLVPGARRRHDERLAEARAAAARGGVAPGAGGGGLRPLLPPRPTESSRPSFSRERAAPTSRPAGAITPPFGASPPFGVSRPSVPASAPSRADRVSSVAPARPSSAGRQAPAALMSPMRWVALLFGVSGLGLAGLGTAGMLSERRAPSAEAPLSATDAALRPPADAAPRAALAAPPASGDLASEGASPPAAAGAASRSAAAGAVLPSAAAGAALPSAAAGARSQGVHGDAAAPAPHGHAPAAPSQKRPRPPPRKPLPAGHATASGGPARPTPPLPVDAGAIGDDG